MATHAKLGRNDLCACGSGKKFKNCCEGKTTAARTSKVLIAVVAFAILGGDTQLHDVVEEFPNARERLTHVGKMTENAANTVLNLVDAAKPECDDLAKRGEELGQSLSRMAASEDLTIKARARSMGRGWWPRRDGSPQLPGCPRLRAAARPCR